MSTYYKYHLYKDQCKDAIFEIQVQKGAGAWLARTRCCRFLWFSRLFTRCKNQGATFGSALLVLIFSVVGVALVNIKSFRNGIKSATQFRLKFYVSLPSI